MKVFLWLFGRLFLLVGLTAVLGVAGLVVCVFAQVAGFGECDLTPFKPKRGSPEHEAELQRRIGNCVYTISFEEWGTLKESEIDRRLALCAQMTIDYDRLYH